jgi:hypothetical protein
MTVPLIIVLGIIVAVVLGALTSGGRKKRQQDRRKKPGVPDRRPRCPHLCDYCIANRARDCYKGEGHSGKHACPEHMVADMQAGEDPL